MASHWLVTLSLTSRFVWKRLLDNKMKFNVSNCSNTQLLNLIEQLGNEHSIYLKRIVK